MMNSRALKPLVIFLMGPTASGKTDLAIELHQRKNCELISVDSALVYQGLDIGTAKPTAVELQQAPHHLIDIRLPENPYSASQFCIDAKRLIEDILGRGKIPVLVGGTMLYFKALRDGLADLPEADANIRQEISDEAEKSGWPSLHEKLMLIDEQSAMRIKPKDGQRIQRALEVYTISGKTLTRFFAEQAEQSLPYPILNIAIAPSDRATLQARIALRFQQMLDGGLIDEVKALYQQDRISSDLPAMRSVGYRQVHQYLEGEFDSKMMQEKVVIASRQLAKRQMTWLRSWPGIHWLESSDETNYDKTCQLIDNFEHSASISADK